MKVFLFLFVILFLMLPSVYGKVYKWVDREGNIHFTDNVSGIPLEYRNQVEKRETVHPSPQRNPETLNPSESSPISRNTPIAKRFTVPLFRIGNTMLVDTVLNGYLRSKLVVDTGAELTVISKALAQRLGLDLDNAAVIPMRSASGVFWAPLAKVKSIAVGEAIMQDVEVIVHDILPGNSDAGLLGMSFLDGFQVTLSAEKKEITLTALAELPDVITYGGHPGDWWKRKFRFYRRQIATIEKNLQDEPSPRFERALQYFRGELAALERKASFSAVPRNLRY